MKDEAAGAAAPEAGASGEAAPPARGWLGALRRFFWEDGYVTAALPVLATFSTILLFLLTYFVTYECVCGCLPRTAHGRYPKRLLLACCEKPYFTDLFNTLQVKNGLNAEPTLAALFPHEQTPTPTPAAQTPTPSPTPKAMPFHPGPVLRATTYQGHVAWSLFTGLYAVACLAALCIGAWVIVDAYGLSRRGRLLLLLTAALAVGAAGAAPFWMALAGDSTDIFTQIVDNTANKDIYNVSALEFGMDGVGLALAAYLAFAASATLFRRGADPAEARLRIAAQHKHLTLILYTGTTLLILATLRIGALLRWSLAFLQPPPWLPEPDAANALFIYKGIEGLVSNLIVTVGAFGTLLLAALYLPAAFILHRRAAALESERTWAHAGSLLSAKARGLGALLPEHALRVAAILGPMLAGPVGELLGRLK